LRPFIATVGIVLAIGMSVPLTAASAAVTTPTAAVKTHPPTAHPRTRRATPPPEHPLLGVSCVSSKHCVAVGERYSARGAKVKPLAEVWNGRKWATTAVKLPRSATAGFLDGISCPSARRCVAVGAYLVGGNHTRALAESWNGRTWTESRPPDPGGDPNVLLDAVSCVSARYCVAVGSSTTAELAGAALMERWNGRAWAEKTVRFPAGNESGDMNGVSCPSARRCLAVGGYYLRTGGTRALAEWWNGRTWSRARPPLPGYAKSPIDDDVSCASPTSCVVVGTDNSTSADIGGFSLSWYRGKWGSARVSRHAALSAVSCPSPKDCLAVGRLVTAAGRLIPPSAGRWNGKRWRLALVPHPRTRGRLAAGYLDDVKCLSSTDCVAVGAAVNTAETPAGFSEFWNGRAWRLVRVA